MSQTKTQLVEGLNINTSAPADALAVDNNGRVGVGTTSVTGKLSIDGSALNPISSLSTASNYAIALYGGSTTGNGNGIAFCNDNGTAVGGAIVHIDQGSNNLGDLAFYTAATSNSPTERVRIDSSGRVGIGETSMDGLLVIKGNSDDASLPSIRLKDGTDTREAWISNSSGDLVLVNGGDDNVPHCKITLFDGNLMTFRTTNTERARINSVGAFKANTTGTYQNSGSIVHEFGHDNATDPGVQITVSNTSYTGEALRVFCTRNTANGFYNLITARNGSGANRFAVSDSGNCLNVNNSYGALSDLKLKENIVDANSQWDDLKALQVRNYNFKEDPDHRQIGVIAQEIELVSPGLVSETADRETFQVPVLDENGDAVLDENGDPIFNTEERTTGEFTKVVNYSVLYMKAVKALQEAMERIETLETANASQAATIATLDARLTALEGAG